MGFPLFRCFIAGNRNRTGMSGKPGLFLAIFRPMEYTRDGRKTLK